MKNAKFRIKKGDLVEVISGREKGKRGTIIKVDKAKDRVYVEQVNLIKKHVKSREGRPGEIMEKEAGIHVSNVMAVDPGTEKVSRVGFKVLDDGTKVRIAKKSGEMLDKE
ncbi:50S ribosomal protein L24 [bacterium]|jgi:large subunit ribosomal protein L24|nr:50S ribosomal protein L24 [bacterium]